jgi:hypothetical protein
MLLHPTAFAARTVNRWPPFASPRIVHGEPHDTGVALSSEHVTLVGTPPVVRHAKVAVRELL